MPATACPPPEMQAERRARREKIKELKRGSGAAGFLPRSQSVGGIRASSPGGTGGGGKLLQPPTRSATNDGRVGTDMRPTTTGSLARGKGLVPSSSLFGRQATPPPAGPGRWGGGVHTSFGLWPSVDRTSTPNLQLR